jgi:hypothetical protein
MNRACGVGSDTTFVQTVEHARPKGEYGPLNPILFSPQKKSCARLFPTSSHRQPVRVAEALRIGPGAKARVVHLRATYRWHPASRASSLPAQWHAKSHTLAFGAD